MMAMESEHVTGDMVEATEFPQLCNRYAVMAVPKTVINGLTGFEGSLPEAQFVDAVISSLERKHT